MSRPLYVLGISAFYHDAAAALSKNGELLGAAQEERFTRKKHDPRFPVNAIASCLGEANIEPDELSAVCFYDNPALSFDRVMRTFAASGRGGMESFARGVPNWFNSKFFVERLVREELKLPERIPVLMDEHHFSHAASTFFPSPFEEAAILTCDGVGEWATTTLGVGEGSDLRILKEIRFPHSIGLLYSAFTYFCGFKVNSGEYKLMGLAPYGKPRYADAIREHLITVRPDGSFRLNLKYFEYTRTMRRLTNEAFHDLFDGPPREPESRITRREMDLAASIQLVTEEVVMKLCRHLKQLTGKRNLCLAGGVALNCVANGKVLKEQGLFDRIWIQPAAGDAGGAIGAALHATYAYLGCPRAPVNPKRDGQKGSYLGPHFTNEEVRAYLDHREYPYHYVSDRERSRIVAKALSEGKIVGWAVGPMEFGPRALGARSILGDARNERTQADMNVKIKFRESFRPFAPSVLEESCSKYFDIQADSPYMLLVAPVRDEIKLPVEEIQTDDMLTIVNQKRSTIPAITHVDYSARIQTVSETKPDYYDLIKEFERLTGYGVIVNTSFNVRGEPIVCSPRDSYTCFMRTNMDMLVLENCILFKQEQPHFEDVENWQKTYELD